MNISNISTDKKRNSIYTDFLNNTPPKDITLDTLSTLGARLMRKANIHHHFFADLQLITIARYLCFFYLQLPYNNQLLFSHPEYLKINLSNQQAREIIYLFEKLISERIPVEYITQEAYYLGHKFYVNQNVLVPRSIMNTRFSDFVNQLPWGNYRVLDLCTGSGCIGLSLALLNPRLRVDLSDICPEALQVAQQNINTYCLEYRVRALQSNVFENITEKYDLIITNPPYVCTKNYHRCPPEFKNEPKLALEAGADGLAIIDRILQNAKNHLTPQGQLIAEVGFTTAKQVKKKYKHIPFTWYKYRRPSGKESFFGMHGIFQCSQQDL